MSEVKLDTTPRVGLGATVHIWGSKISCTISSVSRNRFRIVMKRDIVKEVSKKGEPFVLKFDEDPEGEVFVATRRQDGSYRLTNTSTNLVEIGFRKEEEYKEGGF